MNTSPPPHTNPYIVGRPVEGVTLYGRDDVFRFVYDTLASSEQNAVVLYGQRRAGKTSILRELPHRLPGHKFHFTFFDLQGQAKLDLAEVLYNLAVAIAEPLKLPPPNKQNFQFSKDYFRKSFMPIVWQKLGERRLLLLFDEFEVPSESQDKAIRDRAEQEFYPYMRELLDKETRLSFVFVIGRRIDDLAHWVKRVFKEAQYKKIGLLQPAEAIELITRPAKPGLTYRSEAVEAILNLTSGHPFFTQLICFELFNYAQKRQAEIISAADVEAMVGPALESGKLAFTWLWEAISTSGKIYLAAVAQLRAENRPANKDTIPEVLNRFRIRTGADWSSVPRELADWDLLKDHPTAIQFVVRLMELWVRGSYTLRDMKAALLQEGEADFKKARAMIQQGQTDLAIKALRDLLTVNPNHLGAQLALAQTLLEQKQLKEAVDAFEAAFWLDEDVGRDGLIDARLALALALEEKNYFVEAAVHYRRVLELKADEYRSQEKLRVLYDQGRKAAAAGEWEKAAHFLERVTDIDRNYKDAHQRRDSAYYHAKMNLQAKGSQPTLERSSLPPLLRSSKLWLPLLPPIGGFIVVLLVLGGIVGALLKGQNGQPDVAMQTAVIIANATGTAAAIEQATAVAAAYAQTSQTAAAMAPTQTAQAAAYLAATETAQTEREATLVASAIAAEAATAEALTVQAITAETTTVEILATAIPSHTPSATPTPTATPTASPTTTPTPATPTDTPTPIIIEVVVTATPTPTPVLPSYPQPQLIAPPNLDLTANPVVGVFTGRNAQPRLEWAPIPGLGLNDFYTVSVSFPTAAGIKFGGATTKNTFWNVDQRFYDEVAGPDRDFRWFVVVSHFADSTTNTQGSIEPIGQGVEVSPRSEERVFRW